MVKKSGPYSLLAELEMVKGKGHPPLHLWNPESVKDIDMEIRASGDWFYLGTPIERQRLVHLFASVLRREDDDFYLVTPVEKCRIRVADVPFVVIAMQITGAGEDQTVSLTTNMAEVVTLDADHPLRFERHLGGDEVIPYVEVRDGLDARLNRSVYYELADHLVENETPDGPWLGIWSSGQFFAALPLADAE